MGSRDQIVLPALVGRRKLHARHITVLLFQAPQLNRYTTGMSWIELSKLLGPTRGGAVRNAIEELRVSLGGGQSGASDVAFTIAVVSLCAKMAKADGVAVQVEAMAFEQKFQVQPEDMANVRRLFDLAKQDVGGFESYAEQIARLLAGEPTLRADVLECLFHVAVADGLLHQREESFLQVVAEKFSIDAADYQCMRARFVRDPASPYLVLGASPADSDAVLKARHRQLVLEHHPDRLMARGVPKEFVTLSQIKLAAINAAWDAIRTERRI